MLGLAPVTTGRGGVDPSAWWRRDVLRLTAWRAQGEDGLGRVGGPALLWCFRWPEGKQLEIAELDPLFIEVCRRVRLMGNGAQLEAHRSTSAAARTNGKSFKGAVGDPWAPVHRADGKALTLGERNLDYRLLRELLFGSDWEVPFLARPGPGEDVSRSVLVAEALARGNSKTDGLKSRTIPMPRQPRTPLFAPTTAEVAAALVAEIDAVMGALRYAVAVYAARGEAEEIDRDHYARAVEPRARLDAAADALFFPALWARVDAKADGREPEAAERERFIAALVQAARVELRAAFETAPVAGLLAPRARVRAERSFWGRLRKSKLLPVREGADAE